MSDPKVQEPEEGPASVLRQPFKVAHTSPATTQEASAELPVEAISDLRYLTVGELWRNSATSLIKWLTSGTHNRKTLLKPTP